MAILSVADSLATEEDIANYWQEASHDFNERPRLAGIAIGEIAHARAVNQLATDMGIDREDLWKAIDGEGPLSITHFNRAADLLGLKPIDSATPEPV
jgi:probable addiction module antidote protein